MCLLTAEIINYIIIGIQSLAIFITLIILIYQTRKNNKFQQMNLYHSNISKLNDIRDSFLDNKDFSEIYEGDEKFTKLIEEVGQKTYYHQRKLFSLFECIYLQHKHGLLDENTWLAWEKNMIGSISVKKSKKLWEMSKKGKTYNKDFINYIDSKLI